MIDSCTTNSRHKRLTQIDYISNIQFSEWQLLAFNSRRVYFYASVSTTAFVDAYYDLVIQRRSGYYMTTFIAPSFVITTLAIIGIFAPFNDAGDREEKVTMGLTTLLAMAVILLSVTSQAPSSSSGMPLLGTIYGFRKFHRARTSNLMDTIRHPQNTLIIRKF